MLLWVKNVILPVLESVIGILLGVFNTFGFEADWVTEFNVGILDLGLVRVLVFWSILFFFSIENLDLEHL